MKIDPNNPNIRIIESAVSGSRKLNSSHGNNYHNINISNVSTRVGTTAGNNPISYLNKGPQW